MFDRLMNMFIHRDELDGKEKKNLADDLEPARPGETDPSILKTIEDALPNPDLTANLDISPKDAKDIHNPNSKEEEKEDAQAEKLRDELFKKFKIK